VLRFALVGVVNSVFGFGVFAGLQLTIGRRVHYLLILLISHVVSVLEAYVLQRWLVFRVSGRWWRDLARFWSVYLVALAINLVALPLLVEIAHVSVLPAQAIVMLGVAMGTFVAHRRFTFRRPRDPSDQPSAGEIDRDTARKALWDTNMEQDRDETRASPPAHSLRRSLVSRSVADGEPTSEEIPS
jgi:putative flippase GtrA